MDTYLDFSKNLFLRSLQQKLNWCCLSLPYFLTSEITHRMSVFVGLGVVLLLKSQSGGGKDAQYLKFAVWFSVCECHMTTRSGIACRNPQQQIMSSVVTRLLNVRDQ